MFFYVGTYEMTQVFLERIKYLYLVSVGALLAGEAGGVGVGHLEVIAESPLRDHDQGANRTLLGYLRDDTTIFSGFFCWPCSSKKTSLIHSFFIWYTVCFFGFPQLFFVA